MLAVLTDVVRNIVVLMILVTILEMLLPRRGLRPFVNTVVGLILMLLLLAPLRNFLPLSGSWAPVGELEEVLGSAGAAAKQAELEELNGLLTLTRYRQLLAEKVEELLGAEGLEMVSFTLEVEEDRAQAEYGLPRQLTVVARPRQGAGSVAPVERVELGPSAGRREAAAEPAPATAARLALALGLAPELVEVSLRKY